MKCFNNSNIITVIAIIYISSNLHCLKLIHSINWYTFLQLLAESWSLKRGSFQTSQFYMWANGKFCQPTHCILPLIVHAPLFYTFSMHRWKGSKILILMSKVGCHQDKFHCCISHFPQTSSFHFFCWLDFLHYPIFSRMFFLVEWTLKENTLHIFRNEIWLRFLFEGKPYTWWLPPAYYVH